ncbi:hypothetical protein AGMMS50293_13850 [Spirochaetia bacterium]|nr:hypothetical protein AGMMS50293_13850 [Spirochaetia bacterium]
MAEIISDNPDMGEINGYHVKREISVTSGEAAVYHGEKGGKSYALKLFYRKPDAEIVKKLSVLKKIPGLLLPVDSGEYDGRYYEVMDYAAGGSLDDKTSEGTYRYLPMSEDAARNFLAEAARALDACHQKNIFHRDIKPGNFFVMEENADLSGGAAPLNGKGICIGDFGIAAEFDSASLLPTTSWKDFTHAVAIRAKALKIGKAA